MKKISRLQYITNGQSEEEILQEVSEAIDAGVDWIQLRIKSADVPFLEIAQKTRELCRDATLIINDKVDVAKLVDADGVHLGKDDMPVDKARQILGEDKIIGGTANTVEDCESLKARKADYIGLGPYRFTKTKKKLSPVLGVEGYQKIAPVAEHKSKEVPIIAIGGIELGDIEILKNKTGIHGIAVSGLIYNAKDKSEIVNKLNEKLLVEEVNIEQNQSVD